MEDFTKTIYAFLFGPADAFGGNQHLFDASLHGGYAKLFGDDGQILPELTNERFRLYAGIWFLCSVATDWWKDRSEEHQKEALERRWMFFFALGESIRTAHKVTQGPSWEKCVASLSDPRWLVSSERSRIAAAIEKHCLITSHALQECYQVSAQNHGFSHRNWFRSVSTIEVLHQKLLSQWRMLSIAGPPVLLPEY